MTSEQEEFSTGDVDSDVIWSDNPEYAYFQSMINGKMDRGDYDSLAAEILDCQTTGEEIEESGLSWGTAPNSDTVSMSRRRHAPVGGLNPAAFESSDGDTANSRMSDSFSFYARRLDMEMASSGSRITIASKAARIFSSPFPRRWQPSMCCASFRSIRSSTLPGKETRAVL